MPKVTSQKGGNPNSDDEFFNGSLEEMINRMIKPTGLHPSERPKSPEETVNKMTEEQRKLLEDYLSVGEVKIEEQPKKSIVSKPNDSAYRFVVPPRAGKVVRTEKHPVVRRGYSVPGMELGSLISLLESTKVEKVKGVTGPELEFAETDVVALNTLKDLDLLLQSGGRVARKAEQLVLEMIKFNKGFMNVPNDEFLEVMAVEYGYDIQALQEDFKKHFVLQYLAIGNKIAYQKEKENLDFFEKLSALDKVIARSIIMEVNDTALLLGDIGENGLLKNPKQVEKDKKMLEEQLIGKKLWLGEANMRYLLKEGRDVLKSVLGKFGVLPEYLNQTNDKYLDRIFNRNVNFTTKYYVLAGRIKDEVLEVLAKDKDGVFPSEFSDSLLNGKLPVRTVDLLRKNIGIPQLTKDDVRALILEKPKTSPSWPKVQYIVRGANLGEGGAGSVSPVLIIHGNRLVVGVVKKLHSDFAKRQAEIATACELRGFGLVMKNVNTDKSNKNASSLVRPLAILKEGEELLFIMEGVYNTGQSSLTLDDQLGFEDSPEPVYMSLIEGMKGVAFLHEKGLIYGDFKPGNIFVGDKGAKLGDYTSVVSFDRYGVNGGANIPYAPSFMVEGINPFIGTVPNYDDPNLCSPFTPNKYDDQIYLAIKDKGRDAEKYAWKIDAVAIGKTITEMLTAHETYFSCFIKKGKFFRGERVQRDTGYNVKRFDAEWKNTALQHIADKLEDINNFEYTVADAIKDIELILKSTL